MLKRWSALFLTDATKTQVKKTEKVINIETLNML
jgi:hypothetical protein